MSKRVQAFEKGMRIVASEQCADNAGVWTVVRVTKDGRAQLRNEDGRRGKAVTPRFWFVHDVQGAARGAL